MCTNSRFCLNISFHYLTARELTAVLLILCNIQNNMATEEDASQFLKRCNTIVNNGFISLQLIIGQKLGLFEIFADISEENHAKTSVEIAQAAGLKERYVREWLYAMVVSNIIDCDTSGTKFWLSSHRQVVLSLPLSGANFIPMFGKTLDTLLQCFQIDGPKGISYDFYSEFHSLMDNFSSSYYKENLLSAIIPNVPGLNSKLNSSIKCLDIGCGAGVPSNILAQNFPNSHFYGVDFSMETIVRANEKSTGLQNVHFSIGDVVTLNADWTEYFDYVTAFDAIHDQAYPDKVLAEVFRVLKPGGFFTMVDIRGTSNCYRDKNEIDDSIFCYTVSLFHCMPVSLYFDGGMGLGAMWGKEKAQQMLTAAGFVVQNVHDIPQNAGYHYVCYKPC